MQQAKIKLFSKGNRNSFLNNCILLGILIVAAILRFYNYGEIPLTHDEFSALFRTQFDSFSELIKKGVLPDCHPPGIQVFMYYWVKFFGTAAWIIKLPFTIFGLLSILFVYLVAKKWYNETVGLISAAFFAGLQYFVMYSQIARPYASGLFFALAMVYFWSNLVFNPEKKFVRNSILYILFASLCAYNHHFSLFFALITGITGLFFVKKNYLVKYLLSALVIIVLYIPNILIVLHQISLGSGDTWLGKPHNDYFINYISYVFHFSAFIIAIVAGLIIYGFVKKGTINYKFLTISFLWFIIPFLVGFFFSKYIFPVLQYSVLIFSVPFLFFVLFGHLKAQKPITNLIIVAVLLLANTFSLIHERRHYTQFYNSAYIKILEDHEEVQKEKSNIVSIIDARKNITQYYVNKMQFNVPFFYFDSFGNEKEFVSFIKEQAEKFDYLYLGCVSSNPSNTVPIIQEYFPTMEWQRNYQALTTYLFSKNINLTKNIITLLDFDSEPDSKWFALKKENYIDTISFSGNYSYLIDSLTDFSCIFSIPLQEIISNRYNFIDNSVKVLVPDNYKDVYLGASLETSSKIVYRWRSQFSDFFADEDIGKWKSVYYTLKLSDIHLKHKNIQLKVYILNNGRRNFLIDDFTISLREGNPIIYGLQNKIKNYY